MLSRIRDRLFEAAHIDRDSLVLDLRAQTGLLPFGAARVVKHGAVWALAHEDRAFETLTGMAQSLEELDRPQILRAGWDDFDSRIRAAAGDGVAFTAIVGRNALGPLADKAGVTKRAVSLLARTGVLALAETIPSKGQRISELIDLSGVPPKTAEVFRDTEERIFGDSDDPRTNWDDGSLRARLGALRGWKVQCTVAHEYTIRRFTATDIERWFRAPQPHERPSLGQQLSSTLSADETAALRDHLARQLVGRDVRWRVSIAFLTLRRAGSAGRSGT